VNSKNQVLLETRNLVKHFPVYRRGIAFKKEVGKVHAVDSVSLRIREGQTLGLVGESGCGKTTFARTILHLIEPTSGEVHFDGKDVGKVFGSGDKKEALALRRSMQMVFQNPYSSLDPRMTVYDIISETFVIHRHIPKNQWKERVYELLEMVGLEAYHAERYPHEFSGGQRQRISIARALAVNPRFIVADEPVSSLDVSIRAQVLNLLADLQREKGLTYLYISHDLSSVRQISHEVAVMYLGKIVEYSDTEGLFGNPLHPYTQALISDPEKKVERIVLPGEVPSPINPPPGCRFHPRCPYAIDICSKVEPPLEERKPGHFAACHLADKFLL